MNPYGRMGNPNARPTASNFNQFQQSFVGGYGMTGTMMGAGGFDPRASAMGNSMMMGGPGFG